MVPSWTSGSRTCAPAARWAGSRTWTLDVHSAVPVETVEILVNGEVTWSGAAPDAPGSRSYEGTLELPPGGWIAARVPGPETTGWPAMDSYAFGHTAPVWIGAVGSTEPGARRAAAAELLPAVERALEGLRARYGAVDIPKLEGHFQAARAELEAILGG